MLRVVEVSLSVLYCGRLREQPHHVSTLTATPIPARAKLMHGLFFYKTQVCAYSGVRMRSPLPTSWPGNRPALKLTSPTGSPSLETVLVCKMK